MMRSLIFTLITAVATSSAIADDFIENCKTLLELPALRAKQQQQQEAFAAPYNTKLNRMRLAVRYLRGDRRETDQGIESLEQRIAQTEQTLTSLPDGQNKERTQKMLARYRESLKQAQIHRQLDEQTNDREAKAQEIAARVDQLQKELDEQHSRLRDRHRREVGEASTRLQSQWEAYKNGLAAYFKEPGGDFADAKLVGESESADYLSYSRSYLKEGQPRVTISVMLVGPRPLPGNHQEYRDGIKTWTSSFGGQSIVKVDVGAFEAGLTVMNENVDRDTLNNLIDGWLELEKLRDLPLPGGHR